MDTQKVSAVLPQCSPFHSALPGISPLSEVYQNFSSLAKHTLDLTKEDRNPQDWLSTASLALESLKSAFSSAPIRSHHNPGLPFVFEVDASETGVDSPLSQDPSPDGPLLLCEFYSKKLSPAECNYEIADSAFGHYSGSQKMETLARAFCCFCSHSHC